MQCRWATRRGPVAHRGFEPPVGSQRAERATHLLQIANELCDHEHGGDLVLESFDQRGAAHGAALLLRFWLWFDVRRAGLTGSAGRSCVTFCPVLKRSCRRSAQRISYKCRGQARSPRLAQMALPCRGRTPLRLELKLRGTHLHRCSVTARLRVFNRCEQQPECAVLAKSRAKLHR